VELEGYILPTGAAEGEREAFLSRMRSRIVRICAAADGFVLTYGEESLRLKSTRAPHFSTEAPLNGTDAAFFTLAAESEADGSFWGKEQVILCRGVSGGAVFPMALHAETVFALLSRSGETEIHNPGDLECPFTAEITAEDGELSSVRLMLDEAYIAVNTPLREAMS